MNLKFKLDTGAQANVFLLGIYQQIFPENIENNYCKEGTIEATNTKLIAYLEWKLNSLGILKYSSHIRECTSDAHSM